eukprot:gnl/Dysnectes_brevis/449_a499_6736.p1 GENE.gnl/Dysnectes_brevis/449_a499_6736~~gnl/Dysnectes_brevis/449_a499_6736.p1  ORF type:complete len:178 (+),score=15.86 gnl/Dysnectes_brevis/449_a499_6736:22-555(+)
MAKSHTLSTFCTMLTVSAKISVSVTSIIVLFCQLALLAINVDSFAPKFLWLSAFLTAHPEVSSWVTFLGLSGAAALVLIASFLVLYVILRVVSFVTKTLKTIIILALAIVASVLAALYINKRSDYVLPSFVARILPIMTSGASKGVVGIKQGLTFLWKGFGMAKSTVSDVMSKQTTE